jgi:small nuclear ribonucleoprotein (snRNP)-like protein
MKQKSKLRMTVLKRMIGKRVAVIVNHNTSEHYYGEVTQSVDENALLVKNDQGEEKRVSIFDIRNPNQEL